MSYPDPCATCSKNGQTNCGYGCAEWKIRYLYRQKQVNAYFRQLIHPMRGSEMQAFCYEHPDIIRQYLRDGPCAYCEAAETCDIPCPVYWRWWDARMEWIRRRLGL